MYMHFFYRKAIFSLLCGSVNILSIMYNNLGRCKFER